MTTRAKANGTALERRIVEDGKAAGLNARRQPLSGVLKDFPNDVVLNEWLVEAKMRAACLNSKGEKILSLNLDWLKDVIANARKAGFRTGILVSRAKGSPQLYVTLQWEDFLELIGGTNGGTTGQG